MRVRVNVGLLDFFVEEGCFEMQKVFKFDRRDKIISERLVLGMLRPILAFFSLQDSFVSFFFYSDC
jgi:hypothetical protein